MAKKPMMLSLEESTMQQEPSYVISNTDAGLILRSFIFQNRGKLFSADGQTLSAISADDIDWGPNGKNPMATAEAVGTGNGAEDDYGYPDDFEGAEFDENMFAGGNSGPSPANNNQQADNGANFIGQGASGKVYHAKLKSSGTPIAVKCIPISSKSHRDEVERELKILTSKYNTEFIVANYGCFWSDEEHTISIAMEWMAYSLQDLVKFNEGLPEECGRDVMFQLLRALAYLHEDKKVIHRDIKPGNILISPKGEVKIGDFGVSTIVTTLNISSTYVGTMLYMAPERLDEGAEYTFSSDVWSLGLTFIAAITGENPWGGGTQEMNLFQLLQRPSGGEVPTLPDRYSASAKDFVAQCLQRDPHARPSCSQLLKHPFFSGCTVENTRENVCLLMSQTARLTQQAANKNGIQLNL